MCKGFSQILKEGIQSTYKAWLKSVIHTLFVKLFSYEQDVTQSASYNKQPKPHPSHCVELKAGVKRQGLRNATIKSVDYRRGPGTKLCQV